MARNLRQEIIATPAVGMGDGNHTTGRSGLYMRAYINNTFIGGLESFSFDENTGVTFRRQIGNSFNEPEPNPYDVSGSFTRFQIRGKTLRQIMAGIYSQMAWIDFRALPVSLRIHQLYQSASGQTTFEDTLTILHDVWFTRVSESQPNETGNRMETVQFVARGVEEKGKNITTLNIHGYMLGGAFPALNPGGK
jgi:hypothetical protein